MSEKQSFEFDDILIEEDVVLEARRLRLKQVREATGKTPDEIGTSIGIGTSSYYDLENCNGELNTCISLGELSNLSGIVGVSARYVFDDKAEGEQISPGQLCGKIKAYLDSTHLSVADFEDKVGFYIEPALRNSAEVLNWNVDCLRFVCTKIGLDWRLALP